MTPAQPRHIGPLGILLGPPAVLLLMFLLLRSDVWWITTGPEGTFQATTGNVYLLPDAAPVPLGWLLHTPTDGRGIDLQGSRLEVFHHGQPLVENHLLPAAIESLGVGEFLFWKEKLYLSLPDGADPNSKDALQLTYPVRFRAATATALGVLWVLVVLWRRPDQLRIVSAGYLSMAANHRRACWQVPAAVIFLLALALRLGWTSSLEVPYMTPDSASYMAAADNLLAIPLTEIRTAGLPLLIRLSFALTGGAEGILPLHNAAWALSTLTIVLVLYRLAQWRVAAIALLLYLGFVPKNLAFEYQLMSEHLSRCLYVAFLVAMLYLVRHPANLWVAVSAALVAFANFLVKPSAIVLLPAGLLCYAVAGLYGQKLARRATAIAAGCFAVVLLAGLSGYGQVFKSAYGKFGFTHSSGYNFFGHMGHLIDLDGPLHRPLKERLRPLITRYRSQYVAHGQFEQNWMIYGSTTERLRADFGTESPSRAVVEYADDAMASGRLVAKSANDAYNQVFLDLALEGIRHDPFEYLKFAGQRTLELLVDGTGFQYGLGGFPPQPFAEHAAGRPA